MRYSLRYFVLTGLISLAATTARADAVTVLSTCMDIGRSGVYRLDRDLTGTLASACLRIHDTSDVELDCQGHQVTTDAGLAAIMIETVKNFTLKACSLPQFSGYSLFVGNSYEGTITKNVIRDMVVLNPNAADMGSLHVVGNRFSEFGRGDLTRRADSAEDTSVIPLAPGYNKIEARALADVDLPEPPGQRGPPASQVPSLPSLRVYPNPWRADHHDHMTFDQLPEDGTVKIFTVSAHWVCTLPITDRRAQWDLRNASGEPIASGLYLFLVTTPQGQKTVGQFAVIR